MSTTVPDALVVGHVTKDIQPGGYAAGGTATYAALTLKRLGLRPAVVTSLSEEVDLSEVLAGVPVHRVPSETTTTFVNEYDGLLRTQRILETAGTLSIEHIPGPWRAVPWVLLGPVAGELNHSMARRLAGSSVVAALQGWLRKRGPDGRVSRRCWSGEDVLPHVAAAVVSEKDAWDQVQIEEWAKKTPVLAVTMGSAGARVHVRGRWWDIPAFQIKEIDQTGAGDVFAAAFMARLRESYGPVQAAAFAACVASFCVEAAGTLGIPTRAQVDRRLADLGRQG